MIVEATLTARRNTQDGHEARAWLASAEARLWLDHVGIAPEVWARWCAASGLLERAA